MYPNYTLFSKEEARQGRKAIVEDIDQLLPTPFYAIGIVVVFASCFITLKTHGRLVVIVVVVIILVMLGYITVGVSRVYLVDEQETSNLSLTAYNLVFRPRSKGLVFGSQIWLDATVFVIGSLELGTLVHPYLGSKIFFHYRTHRDGFFLICLNLLWNLGTAFAAIIWLGYVGVNQAEIEKATRHLSGYYGLFIVFPVKHLQAELTGRVEPDILFFNAVFYSAIGIAALYASVIYIIIIVDSSYTESGQLLVKVVTMGIAAIVFGFIVPLIFLSEDGLRHLIFISFYAQKNWSVFFIVGTYFVAVAFGHDLGKFVHDFLNIIHIKGYQSKQHNYTVPRLIRYVVLVFFFGGMLFQLGTSKFPNEGQTNWNGDSVIVGMVFSAVPLLVVLSTINYYWKNFKCQRAWTPDPQWYKNKHHKAVCFADFTHFQGIPGLQDPKEG